jgi:hypothetical protein
MRFFWTTLIALGTAHVMSSMAYAELPTFPKDSISPVYGKWRSYLGDKFGDETLILGPQWIADLSPRCSYRYRYRIDKNELITIKQEKDWVIQLESSEPEWVSNHESHDTCQLPKKVFLYLYLLDSGQSRDAPIGVLGISICDTEEHLTQLNAGLNPKWEGCRDFGGGMIDREDR